MTSACKLTKSETHVAPAQPKPLSFASLLSTHASPNGKNGALSSAVDEAAAVYNLLQATVRLYSDLPSITEVLSAHRVALSKVKEQRLPAVLRALHSRTQLQLQRVAANGQARRLPLRLQRVAPVPLKQFNPVFDEEFQPDKSMDPDRERAAMQRLNRKVKKVRMRVPPLLKPGALGSLTAFHRRKKIRAF
eukprot:5159133-Pleurochrysis_carterae.AAC.1